MEREEKFSWSWLYTSVCICILPMGAQKRRSQNLPEGRESEKKDLANIIY